MTRVNKIRVQGIDVVFYKENKQDFISLTDIARHRDNERSDYILQNWMRNRSTIEFVGLWEKFNNPNFNSIEFDGIKNLAGSNSFSLTPKRWIETTNAIGIVSKTGRYGGTFAHKDIAFEFATWLSAEFKFFLIKEFQRLKEQEFQQLGWDIRRNLAKVNYLIHTDAIRENLIPDQLSTQQIAFIYASEADLLNVALFGVTAKEWREAYPALKDNVRDHANVHQLVCLANLELMNAHFIEQGMAQSERLVRLNELAIRQMRVLVDRGLSQLLSSGDRG